MNMYDYKSVRDQTFLLMLSITLLVFFFPKHRFSTER